MLSQTTLASIAGLLKVDPTALKAAIEDKAEVGIKVKAKDAAGKEVETDFDPAAIQTFTPAELTTRDEQTKLSVKEGYQNAGREITLKTLKEKAGLEFDGKDPTTFLTKLTEKLSTDLKIPADKRVTELQAQLDLVKKDGGTTLAQVEKLTADLVAAKRETNILASMPARNSQIPDEDYLVLLRNKLTVEVVEGKEIYKDAKGEVIRDPKLHTPLDLKGSLAAIFSQNPAGAPATTLYGRGGKNDGTHTPFSGGTPTKYSEAAAVWTGKGKSINDSDFATWIGTLQTANKGFEMDLQAAVNQPVAAAQ